MTITFKCCLLAVALVPGPVQPDVTEDDRAPFAEALKNGVAANEGFRRCKSYVDGWLRLADPHTGLIPRNRSDRYWNPQDSAADNYAFMVLTASLLDQQMFTGRMRDMLDTEIELTSRVDRLPDAYSFTYRGFLTNAPNLGRIMFGSSEYVKDGLLPLTEWLGKSPWSDRMIGIIDDMWKHAPVETPYGKIVSENVEVNGEMLQTLSRVYWMTGDEKYLDWAVRRGDYYLLGGHHPTDDMTNLRLRDHGCEIISGLCELYAAVSFARPEKKLAYQQPVHDMLDRILEVGRNELGLFYNAVNPQTGEVTSGGVADTWGYTFNGFYTVYLIDGTEAYREATRKALSCLNENYRGFAWEGSSSDGYADSIESALNLYNRERVPSVPEWLDSETKVMWAKQQADGVIEGWHGDGNFARTTIMYCLWKTKGVTIKPWREDVVFGAVQKGDELWLTMESGTDWSGKVVFDAPRHKTNMGLPMDWPRINQFPEWFTVESDREYDLRDTSLDTRNVYSGRQLHEGVHLELSAGEQRRFHLKLLPMD